MSRKVEDDCLSILGAVKGGFPFFLLDEVDIDNVFIVILGKLLGNESLAALADTHDYEWQVVRVVLPLLQIFRYSPS